MPYAKDHPDPPTRKRTAFAPASLILVVKIALVIFLAEAAIMLLFGTPFAAGALGKVLLSWDDSGVALAIADGLCLMLVSAPIIFKWIVAPYLAERTAAELALMENERSLRQAQRVAKLAHWRWSFAERRLTSWSGEFPAIYGITDEEVNPEDEGQFNLVHPEDRAFLAATYRAATPANPGFDVQYRIVRADGEVCYLREVAEPEIGADGPAIDHFGIVQDVTEQRLAEEALRNSERTLQDRVAALEAAQRRLEEQENNLIRLTSDLRAARDGAEAASRAKSEFLASMSHELRTPLNAIIGFSEVIKDETFGSMGKPQYRDYAEDIHASGRHLLSLINDILDLSKVESGTDELYEEELAVPETVDTALRLVRERAGKAGVELACDIGEGLPHIWADERKLKQVLVNLLSNAVKFTEAGGKVGVKVRSAPDRGLTIEIADTGIGIAPEDVHVALSQFGQIDNAFNRRHEGTGLGLPLTKALVEMHGGTLDLQSEVGVGTTIAIRLPAWRLVDSSGGGRPADDAPAVAGRKSG